MTKAPHMLPPVVEKPKPPDRRQIKLQGIGGMPRELMRDIYESIIMPLDAPAMYNATGTRPATGILLTGESGTGKTSLVQSIVDALPTIYYQKVLGSVIREAKKPGETLKTLVTMFDTALLNAPSLIFIDQFEMIAAGSADSAGGAPPLLREVIKAQLDKVHNSTGTSTHITKLIKAPAISLPLFYFITSAQPCIVSLASLPQETSSL
jgi:ATP-dependent 26S proteasome regulatory subunit